MEKNRQTTSNIALGVRDYLDSASDAAKLVRTTTIILTFTTVLLFSGLLNACELSWMRLRVENYQNRESESVRPFFEVHEFDGNIVTGLATDPTPENKTIWTTIVGAWENVTHGPEIPTVAGVIEIAPDGFSVAKVMHGTTIYTAQRALDNSISRISVAVQDGATESVYTGASPEWPQMLKQFERPISIMEVNGYGIPVRIRIGSGLGKNIYFQIKRKDDESEVRQSQTNAEYQSINDNDSRNKIIRLFLDLKREVDHRNALYYEKYNNLHKSVVENAYSIKVPVFGVAFDINDLGFLGGISLIIVLAMLRFSLRSYILSLRMGIKASIRYGQQVDFYETLASRQLFAFPTLKDSEQTIYRRKLEYHYLTRWKKKSYNANKEFDSKSHKTLRKLPYLLFVFITLVYGGIVLNDLASYQAGGGINVQRTLITYVVSVVCLVCILLLQYWCLIKWREIYALWNRFYKLTLLTEIYQGVGSNLEMAKGTKQDTSSLQSLKKSLEKLPLFRTEREKNLRLLKHNKELLEKVLRKDSKNTFEHFDDCTEFYGKSTEESTVRKIIEEINELEGNI